MAAALAESAGVQLILAGWTLNSGLLNERDVLLTRELVRGDLFIVTALREEAIHPILKFHPDGVVLLDPGWDGIRQGHPLSLDGEVDLATKVANEFKAAAVPVAVMIDANSQSVKTAARVGASGVVIDCSVYASARTEKDAEEAVDRILATALAASKFGMVASAARGLTPANISPIARISYLEEFFFGQSIAARSMIVGLDTAMREVIYATRHSRGNS